jgi:hypothetical protein
MLGCWEKLDKIQVKTRKMTIIQLPIILGADRTVWLGANLPTGTDAAR